MCKPTWHTDSPCMYHVYCNIMSRSLCTILYTTHVGAHCIRTRTYHYSRSTVARRSFVKRKYPRNVGAFQNVDVAVRTYYTSYIIIIIMVRVITFDCARAAAGNVKLTTFVCPSPFVLIHKIYVLSGDECKGNITIIL